MKLRKIVNLKSPPSPMKISRPCSLHLLYLVLVQSTSALLLIMRPEIGIKKCARPKEGGAKINRREEEHADSTGEARAGIPAGQAAAPAKEIEAGMDSPGAPAGRPTEDGIKSKKYTR